MWTAADPAMLDEGQLVDARNSIYLGGSKALNRAPGRASFGAVSANATAVVGLRDVHYDNGDHYLIALAGDTYKTAPVGTTGTFTLLASAQPIGSQLEVAHFQNRFFLFNGATAEVSGIGTNRVVYLSATAAATPPTLRQHGLLPVITPPPDVTAAGTFALTVTGYYEYWTTEVALVTTNGADLFLESTFSASPTTIFVSSVGVVPVIQQPPIRNTITTHWRVYRSPKKDALTDKAFPTGFMIAQAVIATGAGATASVSDTSVATITGYVPPATFNVSPQGFIAAGVEATALIADDGTYASIIRSEAFPGPSYQGTYGYNFGGFRGTIRGVEVEFQAFIETGGGSVPVVVGIGPRVASTGGFGKVLNSLGHLVERACYRSVTITAAAAAGQTMVVGSPTDIWSPIEGSIFTDADFTANFMITIGHQKPSTTIAVDYLKARVYYGATNDSVEVFPTVVYTFGDITSQVGKHGPPPSSTTGDLYEDSLVVNDTSNSALIRYSYPGFPESFPETYYLDFETRDNDIVRCIKTVNDNLVVWLDTSTWRVNYLPSERDASFDRGKAIKSIASTYGALDPMCVAVFSPGGGTDVAAFVSHHGIHGTEAFNFETYTDGLDWRRLMSSNSLPIALVNDRDRCLLLYYFYNPDNFGAEHYLCLPLSYGEGHWVNGRPKVCGLIHMRNDIGGVKGSLESAWCVQRSTGAVSTYLGYGGADTAGGAGKVFLETGTDMPALDPRIQYTTRRMYLAGFSKEWMLDEVYAHAHGYTAATTTATYTVKASKTNDTGEVTKGSKTVVLQGSSLHKAGTLHQMLEGATISMVATASAFSTEFLILDGSDFGLEDSGR